MADVRRTYSAEYSISGGLLDRIAQVDAPLDNGALHGQHPPHSADPTRTLLVDHRRAKRRRSEVLHCARPMLGRTPPPVVLAKCPVIRPSRVKPGRRPCRPQHRVSARTAAEDDHLPTRMT